MTNALKINPVVLIIINILAPSMYIFLSGIYLQVFFFCFALALLALMRSYKGFIGLALVYGSFMGIYFGTVNHPKLKFIALFLIVIAQSVPCVALAVVLIKRYNSAQLLSALESLHIPRILVVAVTITLKYIPTFKREFSYIMESMRLRGITFTWKRPVKSFQYFVVPQLFRCAALAEEVTAAGMVKGIDVPKMRTSYFEEKIRIIDIVVLAVFAAGIIGGIVWHRM